MRFIILVIVFLTMVSCDQKAKKQLTIAVASNMQFVAKEITKAFTEKSGIEPRIVVGSSGQLTAQITEGAPYDVFISADMKYPIKLYERGFLASQPAIYAKGKLVLWSMKVPKPSMDLLTNSDIQHIAIANPELAPYGSAAIEALQHFELLAQVEPKLVYGESISQTNQFILSGAADIGFTAMSVVLADEMKSMGNWAEIDPNIYEPINQGAVIINHRDEKRYEAIEFYDFLFSDSAKEILNKFGYIVE
ncbi:MAG: molybdate ABC transporter substrate-binding protein [Cyclobacteriaceae bacterium]